MGMYAPNPMQEPAVPPSPEGQLAFYGVDDPEWAAMLLEHCRQGGRCQLERTGDLVILPVPLTGGLG